MSLSSVLRKPLLVLRWDDGTEEAIWNMPASPREAGGGDRDPGDGDDDPDARKCEQV